MDFPKIAPGEEVLPAMQGYRMACCDCQLVHTLNFRVVEVVGEEGGVVSSVEPDNAERLRVILTADRDEEATERLRARKVPPREVEGG